VVRRLVVVLVLTSFPPLDAGHRILTRPHGHQDRRGAPGSPPANRSSRPVVRTWSARCRWAAGLRVKAAGARPSQVHLCDGARRDGGIAPADTLPGERAGLANRWRTHRADAVRRHRTIEFAAAHRHFSRLICQGS
jgi:hypothetical protein